MSVLPSRIFNPEISFTDFNPDGSYRKINDEDNLAETSGAVDRANPQIERDRQTDIVKILKFEYGTTL